MHITGYFSIGIALFYEFFFSIKILKKNLEILVEYINNILKF